MTQLSASIVIYKNYNDVIIAAHSLLDDIRSEKMTCKLFLIDNSASLSDREVIQGRRMLRHEFANYSEIEFIDLKKNIGFGAAHNVVLPKINSDFHLIVNPDIEVKAGAISALVNAAQTIENVAIAAPKLVGPSMEMLPAYRREITLLDVLARNAPNSLLSKRRAYHEMSDKDFSQIQDIPFIQGSFLLIRTAVFKNLQGFDESFFMYLEDADLCKRASSYGRIVYVPSATVIHKWEKGSHHNKKLLKYHLQSFMVYFRKWGIRWK
ncbi:glycosyltransferase family 2 protein [Bifidobacterium choloepi]|uniref:Glycosyltransferase family 2 protein n=1 Tax=Bifidobacterium choloepi TaxID=2614131 RepID=A0A6I5N0C0_9BIFI|nr:glycosyltransferase family 2 protein [Bifidobacterium choloepi]NEG70348.1 glycosyltransferase family 2 protein [Bifidobacterium choloepi]